jgi:HK97 family phage major capsid protein
MQLKIQTKLPEGLKADKRKPAEPVKKYDELDPREYLVLGVPFGGPYNGKDSDGQTFTKNTDLWLKDGQEIPVTYYHGFGPDSPETWQETPAVIGVAKFDYTDDKGHWFNVRMDTAEPLAQRITSTKTDKVRASSGAIGHLVRLDGDEISTWPLGELALFDTNEWRKPANDYAVFNAKGEGITEVKAEAETQAVTVDESPEQIKTELTQESEIMEEEIEKKEIEKKEIDIDALVKRFEDRMEARLEKLVNAPPINAPAVIKAENFGDPDPNRAFMHYLRTGEKVKGLKAAMGENTAGVGGYLVPEDSFAGIIEKRNELSIPRRAGATILQTSRDVLNIPVEATSQTYFAQSAHDMAAVNEDEPTIGNAAATIYPFTKLVKVGEDLLEDSEANLNQFLANSFGRWMAMTENRNALIGTGTTAPQGVTVGGTAALTFDDTNSIAAAEIPELYHKLAGQYRDRAVWTMNDDTLGMLRGLASSSVFTFGAHEINEESVMGKRAFTSTYMPKYTTTKHKAIVFGDWSLYALVERKGLVIRRLNELYAGNRQVGLLATFRHGGVVMQSEAFAIGSMA